MSTNKTGAQKRDEQRRKLIDRFAEIRFMAAVNNSEPATPEGIIVQAAWMADTMLDWYDKPVGAAEEVIAGWMRAGFSIE